MGNKIVDIKKTSLKVFPLKEGDVLHAINKDDQTIKDFGEVYFSKINNNCIKGWKRHLKMTLNLVVPVGNVFFVFIDKYGSTKHEIIGEDNYVKLTIPPLIWFAFKGLEKPYSLIMNYADICYDPDEVEKKNLNEIEFNWSELK